MTNGVISESLLALPGDMKTHMNWGVETKFNALKNTITSRLRDFVRINPHIFLSSKVGEEPQEFPDGVYKLLSYIWLISREKEELDLFQWNEVSQILYTKWNFNRSVESSPIE